MFTTRTSRSLVASVLCVLAGSSPGGLGFLGQVELYQATTDLLHGNTRKFATLATDHGLRSCLELTGALGRDDDVTKLAVNASDLVRQITYLQRFG